MMDLVDGPRRQTHAERQALVDRIVASLVSAYADDVIAIGLYGSQARGDDRPFSDIEMCCIVAGADVDRRYEWMYGANKAEVAIRSADVYRKRALATDAEKWPLAKGAFLDMRCVHGDGAVFEQARGLVRTPPAAEFDALIGELVVELYEWIGKLRNAMDNGDTRYVPFIAFEAAKNVALMLGIANRHCFTTGALMFEETLALEPRPDGYDALVRLVTTGELADPAHVTRTLEQTWRGVVAWVEACGVPLDARVGWPLPTSGAG